MFRKRGDIATNQLVTIILAVLVILVVFPATVLMANTTDYETKRITCLSNAIIRDKIFESGRDFLYDLDCETSHFVVKDTEILYETVEKEDGEKKISYKNIIKYKKEEIKDEVYDFTGKQVVSGWRTLGGGELSIEGSKGEKNCLIISTISFQTEDAKFKFERDSFIDHIQKTTMKSVDKKETIFNILKADNGESIFYFPKGFDESSNEMLYVVYMASDEKYEITNSRYSMFLGHGEDISNECDRLIS